MSISFITLLIFIYQTDLMRRQNYLSILPYMDMYTSANTHDNAFTLGLKNHGIGPAILESVHLIYKDQKY